MSKALVLASPKARLLPLGRATSRQALAAVVKRLPKIVAKVLADDMPLKIADLRIETKMICGCVEAAKLGLKAQQTAAEAWLSLERRLGELLPGLISLGRPKKVRSENHFRLSDLHLSKTQSMRAQALAAISLRVMEGYFRDARRDGWEITWGGNTGLEYRAQCGGISDIARQRGDMQDRARARYYKTQPDTTSPGSPERIARWSAAHPDLGSASEPSVNGSPAVSLRYGDCLDLLSEIPSQSVDLIITDLPYGKTPHPWNRVLDLSRLWAEYRRIIRPYRPILLFGIQPFTSELVMSAPKDWLKHEMIWEKTRAADFIHANNRPLRVHENISVFSEGAVAPESRSGRRMNYYPEQREHAAYPRSIVKFATESRALHPMAKPVALLKHLIQLFSRPGEMVLDSCMGSGSTGVAAIQTGRNFIGIEKHQRFFDVAVNRLGALGHISVRSEAAD